MRKLVRAWAWFLGLVWGLPLLFVLVGIAVLPGEAAPPGSCSTFGCTYSQADGFALLAWIAAVTILVPVGILGCVVIAAVQVHRSAASEARSAEL